MVEFLWYKALIEKFFKIVWQIRVNIALELWIYKAWTVKLKRTWRLKLNLGLLGGIKKGLQLFFPLNVPNSTLVCKFFLAKLPKYRKFHLKEVYPIKSIVQPLLK